MRVGIIGRTGILLKSAEALREAGHELAFIATCKAELFYDKNEIDFQNYSSRLNIPFFNTLDLESKIDSISALKADICISINWLKLLDESFLSIFPLGILNTHAGDLPRYKGNAAVNWAILNFEQRVALTIHKMEKELDSGPYILKEFMKIDDQTYVGDIYQWLSETIPIKFVDAIKLITQKSFIEQNKKIRSLRTYPRKPEDSRINWSWNRKTILSIIRASSHPFNGAFCYLNNMASRVVIYRASEYTSDFDYLAIPGQVCFQVDGNPIVATQDGLIEIEEYKVYNSGIEVTKESITKSMRNRLI
jgi:methionyl-tRNA formyltransferase